MHNYLKYNAKAYYAVDSILCPVAAANISKFAHEQLKNDWIRPSLNHAASTHAILAFTALRLSMARPDVPYYIRFAERQRLLAIMAMRRSLEHSNEATCNENLTAVYNLICFEETLFLPSLSHSRDKALQPDYTQLKAHINGLRQMVALRGNSQVPFDDRGQGIEPTFTNDTTSSGSIRLQTKLALPRGLMKQIYSYPESSFFFTGSTLKVSSWCKAGLHHGLREFLITADCLLKDTSAWLRQPDSYKWDLLGVQSLYGLAIEMFPRWRYEASSGATNADQLVALFTEVLIFFISNNGQLLDYIPMHLSNIQDLVSDPKVWPIMRAAGLDLWLAFLLVLSSSHQAAYRDYFFRMHVDILEFHKPKIHSVEEYVQNLNGTLWLPQRLDKYAQRLWYRTKGKTE
ncbi:hypothetical protein CDV36_005086 [Fusarium kuroshium]|uniref:Transcription factor domain-containing protein n=2 Tax=Fusarium solani species complex TaxID=232080 RepID=A0A3M2SDL7_9HYPO|nr:hypothetical protein CDV36_005086 [Fusarium kuroshium]RSL75378.1 hypothetical protein CEP51_010916 [Fusarium floridanum]